MPSPAGFTFALPASLTGNAQVDSLIYGTYWMDTWSNGTFSTALTYSFMTTDSYFARSYSDVNEYTSGYVLSSAQQSAIVSALSKWSSVADIKFTQVSESSTNVGDLRFGGYGNMDDGTAAWGYFPGLSASAGDVWIGPATSDPSPVQGSYDYLTFVHEIGHALGLKHPFSPGLTNPTVLAAQYDDVRYTVMSYSNSYSYEPTTPMLLDIAAIQSLYGANTHWQTGNNTYSWAADQSVFETIWDAGGNDTIDASNQLSAVRINLNEGQFSKIGQAFLNIGTNTAFNEGLAIAYGAKIENAVGSANDDTLIGNALGNVLNGLAGKDIMIGGAGNDIYMVDDLGDVVSEGSTLAGEIDTVRSSVNWVLGANLEYLVLTGSDNLNGTGNAFANILVGTVGDNLLDGGAGQDTLVGGAGDDIYVLDNLGDAATELAGQGHDLVRTSVSHTLSANIEDGQLLGVSANYLIGNVLDNSLIGNSAANVLNGLSGADTMEGGAGNDAYVVDNIGDTVIEQGTSLTEIDSVVSSISYTLGSNLEILTLVGTGNLDGTGNALNNRLTGNTGANVLDGGVGIDTLIGGAGNDTYVVDNLMDVVSETSTLVSEVDTVRSSVSWTLGANLENLTLTGVAAINGTGTALGNVLIGNAGSNVLNGGAGRDTLIGGAGNDTYLVDNVGDMVTELTDEGHDLVRTTVSYTLSANVEDGQLLGLSANYLIGNALDNSLIGNSAANVLNGLGGADTMIGGAGNDTYVVDNIGDTITEAGASLTEIDSVVSSISYTLGTNLEILTLTGTGSLDGTGNALNNRLTGNTGANVLDGGVGIDTLIGGAGNDTYVVDNLKDVVSETSTLVSEVDTVRSSVSWTLGANLENLTLTGTAAINGTGNALGNVLTGNAGNNVLNGGAGRDTLIGGAGNDTYVLDQVGELAILQEQADQGTDSLSLSYVSSSLSSVVDLNLGSLVNVENVTLNGTGVFTIIGNGLDNSLVGNASVNTLWGEAGDDILDGRMGADILIGGTGDDIYVIDSLGDKVTELADEGHDLIRTAVSYTLSANVEDGQLLGIAALNLVGNALDNSLIGNSAANVLNGLGGADTMIGGAGNDTYVVDNIGDTITEAGASLTEIDSVVSSISYTLGTNLEILTLTGTGSLDGTGNALNNRLTGNTGANVLDGGVGIDTLIGGAGNDTYVVDNLKDVVSETSTLVSEVDTVRSSVSWTLGANLENLTLTGTAAINGTGNALGNVLTGNAGNNVLNGGAGRDTLIGGAGNDTYVLDQVGELAILQEQADQGTDSLSLSYVSSSLSSVVDLNLGSLVNVENVTLNGTGVFTIIGNGLDNSLVGNASVNTLWGEAGDDILDGRMGADILIGGTGDDIYVIDSLGDKVTELADEGHDLIRTAVSYTLSANVEDGQLLGIAALNLVGNALDNSLIGNSAANVLNGLGGADTMIGGTGNDTYVVDNIGDTITEAGASLTEIDSVVSSISYTLGTNLEILTLTGTGSLDGTGNALNNRLTGNTGANVLDGGVGIDTLIGGAGNDTYVVDNLKDVVSETSTLVSEVDTVRSSVSWTLGANLENLTLTGVAAINGTGNTLGNVLTGNAGNNVLNGGAGRDTLIGDAGNDTYLVDNLGDTITELADEGRDLVRTSVSHTLSTNVEDGLLLGVAAINLFGNASNNSLVGNSAANVLSGLDGADILDGGAGIDTLIGGTGNDTYIVDNLKDVISETSTLDNEIDTVRSSVSWTLGANLENLTLTGVTAINATGNALGNVLTGNAASNTLNGGAGNDQLDGGAGNDLLIGGIGADTLSGGAGADRFVFSALNELGIGDARDVILDFSRLQGDKLDLSKLDANILATGISKFSFIDSADFSGAGQLRFVDHVLSGNIDGNLGADFEIQLVGVNTFSANDLVA